MPPDVPGLGPSDRGPRRGPGGEAAAGGQLTEASPRRADQTCPERGRVDKGNRQTRAAFKRLKCGRGNNADVAGAINISRRAGRPSESARAPEQPQAAP
ncbi:MAG: transposase [Deltaproteobacteria bacterium]|jgi:transposase|nr:transposase [Deltaproteobacteria bacterium]